MADVMDAAAALVTQCAAAAYPTGTGNPSVAGVAVKVYSGWPVAQQLQTDIEAGGAHVSVYPTPTERNTTRYMQVWKAASVNTPTLTAALSGQQVTIGGTAPTAQNPQVISLAVNGGTYTYAAQTSDTPTSIATALAALILPDYSGTSSAGAVLTLGPKARASAVRVLVTGTALQEIRRQERVFQIVIWAQTPSVRDALSAAIDIQLAGLTFLSLADFTAARLIYRSSTMTDQFERFQVYRRDLLYTLEYATVQTEVETQIGATALGLQVAPGGTPPYITVRVAAGPPGWTVDSALIRADSGKALADGLVLP